MRPVGIQTPSTVALENRIVKETKEKGSGISIYIAIFNTVDTQLTIFTSTINYYSK